MCGGLSQGGWEGGLGWSRGQERDELMMIGEEAMMTATRPARPQERSQQKQNDVVTLAVCDVWVGDARCGWVCCCQCIVTRHEVKKAGMCVAFHSLPWLPRFTKERTMKAKMLMFLSRLFFLVVVVSLFRDVALRHKSTSRLSSSIAAPKTHTHTSRHLAPAVCPLLIHALILCFLRSFVVVDS